MAHLQITELLNLYAHMHLASLRQPAGKPRLYPTGWGFGVVVCANYWYEVLGLVGLIAITGGDIGSESKHILVRNKAHLSHHLHLHWYLFHGHLGRRKVQAIQARV